MYVLVIVKGTVTLVLNYVNEHCAMKAYGGMEA
jgi:hypothetical protein